MVLGASTRYDLHSMGLSCCHIVCQSENPTKMIWYLLYYCVLVVFETLCTGILMYVIESMHDIAWRAFVPR